jgi:hypothetical protein
MTKRRADGNEYALEVLRGVYCITIGFIEVESRKCCSSEDEQLILQDQRAEETKNVWERGKD